MGIATIIAILLFVYMIHHAGQNPSYEDMGYDMNDRSALVMLESCNEYWKGQP